VGVGVGGIGVGVRVGLRGLRVGRTIRAAAVRFIAFCVRVSAATAVGLTAFCVRVSAATVGVPAIPIGDGSNANAVEVRSTASGEWLSTSAVAV